MKFCLALLLFIAPCLCAETFRKHDKFVLFVIPKSGTHFIQAALTHLTGKGFESTGKIGLKEAAERRTKEKKLLRFFSPFNQTDRVQIFGSGFKLVAMLRDPRDALISLLFYMRRFHDGSTKRDFFYVEEDFDALSLDEQLHSLMRPNTPATSYLDFYKDRVHWYLLPECHLVRFEHLVGEKGGGSLALQTKAIVDLVEFLKIKITNKEIEEILPKLYAASPDRVVEGKVFRSASVGQWKTFFNESHKKVFKDTLGQELITLGYEKDLNW